MRHYLDHNATTPVDPRVLARFLEVEERFPGNPGSLHQAGQKARAMVEESREEVARALGVRPGQIVFTSGGTEANNLAVRGLGDPGLPVWLTPTEHPSVRQAAEVRGVVLGTVDAQGTAQLIAPPVPVGLLALVHGQNELGTLQPIGEAADLARKLGRPLHVDAAQTLGRVDLAEACSRADSVALSVHKAGGLRGSGILVVRRPDALHPLLFGGGQEAGLRPGTLSPALVAATALAVALACAERAARAERMARARNAFLEALAATGVPHRILSPLPRCLPNTAMVHFAGVDGRILLPALDAAGIEASQGSACSSGSPTPPAILAAIGLEPAAARACMRFSFGPRHETDDAARAGVIFARTIDALRRA